MILVPVVLLNKVSWLVQVPFLIICFAQCEGIPRHGFRILGTGFQSLSVELGFWIPIASGISDSLSCIPDSKAQDSGFHMQIFPWFWIPHANFSRIISGLQMQIFPGFQIPQAKISRIRESGFPYIGWYNPLLLGLSTFLKSLDILSLLRKFVEGLNLKVKQYKFLQCGGCGQWFGSDTSTNDARWRWSLNFRWQLKHFLYRRCPSWEWHVKSKSRTNSSLCGLFGNNFLCQRHSKKELLRTNKRKEKWEGGAWNKQERFASIGNSLKDWCVTLTGEKTPEHFKDRVSAANSIGRLTCCAHERQIFFFPLLPWIILTTCCKICFTVLQRQ